MTCLDGGWRDGRICLKDWGEDGSMCRCAPVAILDDGSFPCCVEGGWAAVDIRYAVLLVGRSVRCVGMRARVVDPFGGGGGGSGSAAILDWVFRLTKVGILDPTGTPAGAGAGAGADG